MPRLRLSWSRSEPALGIDFGTTAVRAVALGHDRHGISFLGAEREALPPAAVAGGIVHDPEAAGAALARLLGRMEVRGRSAALGIGGPSVFVRRFAGVPAPKSDRPEDRAAFREAVAREAARHLPFHIEDMEFDFQRAASDGAGAEGGTVESAGEEEAPGVPEVPVVFAAAPRDAVRAHRAAARAANREASRLEIEPYALFAALRLESEVAPNSAAGPSGGQGASGGPLVLVEIGSARAGVHLFERPPVPPPPDRTTSASLGHPETGELLASVQISWAESAAASAAAPRRKRAAKSASRRAAETSGATGLGQALAGGIREALRESGRKPPVVVRLSGGRAGWNGIAEPLADLAPEEPTLLEPLGGLPAAAEAAAGPEFAVAAGLAFLRLADLAPVSGRSR